MLPAPSSWRPCSSCLLFQPVRRAAIADNDPRLRAILLAGLVVKLGRASPVLRGVLGIRRQGRRDPVRPVRAAVRPLIPVTQFRGQPGPAIRRNRLHAGVHWIRLRVHRPHDARRVSRVLVARVSWSLFLLSGAARGFPGRRSPALRVSSLLLAVARVLVIGYRQGGLDDFHPRYHRLRCRGGSSPFGEVDSSSSRSGLAGTVCVRPHVTLIAFVVLASAYLVRRRPRPTPLGPVLKVAGLIVLAVLGLLVVKQVESFFSISSVNSPVGRLCAHRRQPADGSGRLPVRDRSRRLPGCLGQPFQCCSGPSRSKRGTRSRLFVALEGTVLLAITAGPFAGSSDCGGSSCTCPT